VIGRAVRRLLGGWYGPVQPPEDSRRDLAEAILWQADCLAMQLAVDRASGFVEMAASDRLETARRLVWTRWRWETRRLTECAPYDVAEVDA
jgi:hypothetical protein